MLPPTLPPNPPAAPWRRPLQALASANETVGEAAEEARGVLAHARAQTVGRLEGYEARWLPTVRRFDKM